LQLFLFCEALAFCLSVLALSFMVCTVVIGLPVTFCSYPKGGTFTTKLDLKN